ncbi:hypothetical protein [Williamsia sp. DF01-3]|uniref:hypothetical protein n=1 Tax=Williamsia sp. DF01-3 TaxID=2934157 RepID=UPI001FF11D17|nr:hypothetical protein [Williamsia sp. DF01-3]MCK0517649.1 hypothetical protein [Williamsia sp. DF01-3]
MTKSAMSAEQLRKIVVSLSERCPVTDDYERRHNLGAFGGHVWYKSQKEHVEGWLGQYNSPGFYNRQSFDRDARFFYTHFKCAAGLLWLAEALGEDPKTVGRAVSAVEAAGKNPASQCGALRRIISWQRIEELIEAGSYTKTSSALGHFAQKLSRTKS